MVEVAPAAVQRDLMGAMADTLTGRQVRVRIVYPVMGKTLFRAKDAIAIEPGGPTRAVTLEKVPGSRGGDERTAPGGCLRRR